VEDGEDMEDVEDGEEVEVAEEIGDGEPLSEDVEYLSEDGDAEDSVDGDFIYLNI
jgi:hypothetical protein